MASREDRLMTIQDVADYLGVRVSTVYRYQCERRGPRYFKVGGKNARYRRSDVDNWLETQVAA